MSEWNGTDQAAKEIFHELIMQEYEKLIRCAIAYLRLTTTETHLINKAEDVVQEMLELAWKKKKDVLSKNEPVGWLYEAISTWQRKPTSSGCTPTGSRRS